MAEKKCRKNSPLSNGNHCFGRQGLFAERAEENLMPRYNVSSSLFIGFASDLLHRDEN